MYWLAEICVRRPVFAMMVILALVVAGGAAFLQLGIDRFPDMDLPTVRVRTLYPGAASEEVESEVSQIIEDAVATVAGIDELRSISSDGQSLVLITFNLNRDIDVAAQDVRDAVAGILNRLPPDIDPPVVGKEDMDSSPIMTLAVSGPRSSTELYLLADRFVKNVIQSAPGVGQVVIAGAAERAVQVDIDARRLAAYQLSILDVRDALVRQNAEVPGGRVDEGIRERTLRTLGRVPHARDFPDLVIKTVNGIPVRLEDVGASRDATKEVRTLARLNGEPAVVLQVQRQSGENTVGVIEAVKQRLPRAKSLLPDDVEVHLIQDQSRYILAALHEIEWHLFSGSLLACVTVLVFMRSWQSMLIAAVAIPTSIVATFAFMRLFDFTMNNVTMLALALMVGVVIDDAIVVLENVFHAIEEGGLYPFQAAIVGTREIGLAVLATTMSLVIVFLPVSFLSSITGRMLYEFGLTATFAILVSMLVSFTLTPTMCARLLKPKKVVRRSANEKLLLGDEAVSRKGFYRWIDAGYMWSLRQALRHRWIVLGLVLVVIAANVPLYYLVRQDYIPTNVDESEFEIRLDAYEGASLKSADAAFRAAESLVRAVPGVEIVLTTVGTRGFGGVNTGQIYVRLTDSSHRTFSLERLWRGLWKLDPGAAWRGNFSQQDVMTVVRRQLNTLPEVSVSVRNLTSLRQGTPVDIDYGAKLSGRVGRWRVGALAVQQDDYVPLSGPGYDSKALGVVRGSMDVLGESSVGFIGTAGDPGSDAGNSLYGVDFLLLNSRLPGGRSVEAEAWFQKSQTQGIGDGRQDAWGIGARMPNAQGPRGGFSLKEIGSQFRPAMGFVSRRGVRNAQADVGWTRIVNGPWLQLVYAGIDAERIEGIGGPLQTQVITLKPLEFETRARDIFRGYVASVEEHLFGPFTIYQDPLRRVTLPAGAYKYTDWGFDLETGIQRRVAGHVTYRQGDFYDGTRLTLGGDVLWRPSKFLGLKLAYQFNDIDLPVGDFSTRILAATAEVNFSSRLSWITLMQYDNVSELGGLQSRVQWVPRAGQKYFLVLNHGVQDFDKDGHFDPLSTELAVRAGYTWRF